MGDISSITLNIGDDTFQIVNDDLLIWKGEADHEPDFTLDMEDVRRLISAASFLKTD